MPDLQKGTREHPDQEAPAVKINRMVGAELNIGDEEINGIMEPQTPEPEPRSNLLSVFDLNDSMEL